MKKIKNFLNRHMKLKILFKKILGVYRTENLINYFEDKIIYGYSKDLSDRITALEKKVGISSSLEFQTAAWAGPKSTLATPFSQPATNAQFLEPIYQEWCNRIHSEKKFHRKQWEYVYILRCLELADMINADKKGLGFGVGFEPIAPYLATKKVHTTATDLSIEEAKIKGWVDTNQYTQKVEDLEKFGLANGKELQRFIQFRNVDMNNIDEDLMKEQFDFTWSACAFEHLGSIDKGLEFVINSLQCLKPGGVAVHTTEINISSNMETLDSGATVLFRVKDFEKLAEEVTKAGHQMKLVLDFGDSRLDDFYDIPPYSEFNHLKIKLDSFITTSFGVLIKKKEF